MAKWGIDLGGTKIECVVLDEDNEIVFRSRLPTEQKEGYEHIVNQIGRLVNQSIDETGLRPSHCGMCTPGTTDPKTGLLKNSNTLILNNKPFLQDIENILGVKVFAENDANCFALAEYHMGVVPDIEPDAKVVFGVILGTGVGGGLVVDGKLISGQHGIAGEWGHNVMDPEGSSCYCGKKGCVETIISGPSLERYFESQSGYKLPLKEVYGLYREGDEYAIATMNRLFTQFGKGISSVVNIVDPDVIVIGGGVGNIPELYQLGLQELEKNIFNHSCHTKIVPPKLGDSGGVFGAAFLS